jgi:hypothetical protein
MLPADIRDKVQLIRERLRGTACDGQSVGQYVYELEGKRVETEILRIQEDQGHVLLHLANGDLVLRKKVSKE